MSVIWGAGVRASLACLTARLVALPISRSTWSCLHLYMPPASGMAQPLRMCSAVPHSWHHTHLSSSGRFHSLRFVGHGNTLYVDQMRNFTIRGSMDHSSLHDSDLASVVSHLVHVPCCTYIHGLLNQYYMYTYDYLVKDGEFYCLPTYIHTHIYA